ncbi:hypothetical protein GJ496_001848 [Pomphorhynchus laevis]|nr:hypothetical protein GJ496_001848 [Pomphorhynchus laevis]
MEFDEDISEDDCIVNANIAKSMAIDLSDIMLDANNAVAVDKSLCRVSEIKRRTVQEEIKCRKKSCADILQESKTEDYIEVKPFTHLKGKKNKDVPNDDILISKNFSRFNISKPILKAITAMHHINPTPIQLSTIPVALEGRDICGCAITGSGKTLAFLIPIVERLLFRPRNKQTRVLILSPTRELAMQTCQVMQQLCQFFPHPINICKAIGGFDLKSQENALKLSPDVVIATPGRLIDHLHNSPSFSLHTVEILVLDEADR